MFLPKGNYLSKIVIKKNVLIIQNFIFSLFTGLYITPIIYILFKVNQHIQSPLTNSNNQLPYIQSPHHNSGINSPMSVPPPNSNQHQPHIQGPHSLNSSSQQQQQQNLMNYNVNSPINHNNGSQNSQYSQNTQYYSNNINTTNSSQYNHHNSYNNPSNMVNQNNPNLNSQNYMQPGLF